MVIVLIDETDLSQLDGGKLDIEQFNKVVNAKKFIREFVNSHKKEYVCEKCKVEKEVSHSLYSKSNSSKAIMLQLVTDELLVQHFLNKKYNK